MKEISTQPTWRGWRRGCFISSLISHCCLKWFLPTALDHLRLAPHQGLGLGLGTLSPLKVKAIPSMWHEGRHSQLLPKLPAPLLPAARTATTHPREVTQAAVMVQGQAAGRLPRREMSSAWMDGGSFKFNSASWRCQRIMTLNFSKEVVCSLWKTQSYRNASLNFPWI